MSFIVDRRLNGRHKSTINRQRFLKRYRDHIREAVDNAINQRSIRDMQRGERVVIPRKDINEPQFHHGPGGRRTVVHPGNREFQPGDRIARPQGGGQGGQASDQGEGLDEFAFQLDPREFLNFLFDGLALPNLVKRQLHGESSYRMVHGGITSEGNPARINIVRSMRQASMRRRALGAANRRQLRELLAEQAILLEQEQSAPQHARLAELSAEIAQRQRRADRIPFLDTMDLRYNHSVRQPLPVSRAVMFCLMDVSGSMSADMKELAKRFFLLLYLFLQRNYRHTDIVFIRHHTSAKEVDEEEFFYSRETGGTIVSSALKLTSDIIRERYPESEWNIYTAQASDGDNWNDDSPACVRILREELLPKMQYFAYVEIKPRQHQALWENYALLQQQYPAAFALQQIDGPEDIYPVFRELFRQRMEAPAS